MNQKCFYGCGQEAKYKFKNGKFCCHPSKNSCPEEKRKNKEINKGRKPTEYTLKRAAEVNKIRMINGDAKKMNLVPRDPKRTLEIAEISRLRMLNGQANMMNSIERDPVKKELDKQKRREKFISGYSSYLNSIRPKDRIEKIRKTHELKGNWTKLEDLNSFRMYGRIVWIITNKSAKEKYTKEELKTRGKKKENNNTNLDHIFSISDGFKNNILPTIIGSKSNLRLICCSENYKKRTRSDITKEKLFELFDIEIKNKEK